VHAASIGVDPATLKAVGATDADIAQGQAQRQLATYAVSGGGFNLNAAVAAGVSPTLLKTAYGFTDTDIAGAQAINATMAVLNKSYKQGDNYEVAQAIADGAITLDQANAAGFTVSKSDVATAQQYSATMAILNKSYKSGDGYLVTQAIADGKITLAQAQAAGFDVSQSDVSAIQSSEKSKDTVMAILSDPKNGYVAANGQYYVAQAVADGKITLTQAQDAGFNVSQSDVTAIKATNQTMSTLAKLLGVSGSQGYTQSQLQFAVDSGKVSKADIIAAFGSTDITNALLTPSKATTTAATIAPPKPIGQISVVTPKKNSINFLISNVKNNAGVLLKDIVSAAKNYNASHSGLTTDAKTGKIVPVGITPVSGGADLGEALGGDISMGEAGIVAALITIGVAVSQRNQITNAIASFANRNKGKNPTANQVTLTDSAGNTMTLHAVMQSMTEGIKPPTILAGGTPYAEKPMTESLPATAPKMPSTEEMPVTNEKVPQESMPVSRERSTGIETFPLGVQAPNGKAEPKSKPATEQAEPTTEAGKKLKAEIKAGQAITPRLTDEEIEKEKADVKAMPDADLSTKTEAGKQLEAQYKAERYAQLMQLRTTAEEIAKLESIVRRATVIPEKELPQTEAGKKLQAEIAGQAYAELNALKDTAAEIAKLESIIRHSTTLPEKELPQTAEGKALQAKIAAQAYDQLTKARKIADELAKAESIYLHSTTLPAKEYPKTADGKAMQAADKAARAEIVNEVNRLRQVAAELEKFQAVIQEAARAQSTVDYKAMSDRISQIKQNESKAHPNVTDADTYDGGSWLIHGDDGSVLYAVMQGDVPLDTPAQQAKVADALEKMWAAKPKGHWSETDERIMEDIASDIGMNRLTNPAAITGRTIEELDRAVADAYVKGELTNTQLQDYTSARSQIASKTISKSIAGQPASSPSETTPKAAYAVAVTAAILAAKNASTRHATAKQTATAIKQAIFVHVGAQSPTVVNEIMRAAEQIANQTPTQQVSPTKPMTAEQINTQQATKAGLKQATQQAIKEANQEQTQEQTRAPDQEKVRDQTQEQARETEKVTPKEATDESVKDYARDDTDTEDDDEATNTKVKRPSSQSQTQADKLAKIAHNRGALAWNQGALYGKRRWDIILYPYDEVSDHLIIFSNKPPAGAHVVTGAKSAFQTARVLYGKAPSKDLLINDVGFEHLTISPTGQGGGISLHYTPITKRPTAISGHKDLSNTNKQSIDGKGQVFPLR
jgi:hypothetical protein